MDKVKKSRVISGAFSLGLGAFLAKVLGAIYRVPLTNLLGSEGLGLYQMVFPVYTLLLDFSGAAVPSAISKIISSYKEEDKEKNAYLYLQSSLRLLFFLGGIFSVLMATFSRAIAEWQGDMRARFSYITLSPAVFFVCIISCFRGYYQGLLNMTPTAISQVLEQIVKLIFGLTFSTLFMPDIMLAASGAALGITVSEIFTTAYFFIIYNRRKKEKSLKFTLDKPLMKNMVKSIVKTSFPITLVGILIPLSQVVDSFLIINILSSYRTDATSLYGLFSGAVATIINLPVSVCYGIATVAIPGVSSATTEQEKVKVENKVMTLTAVVSLTCVVGIIVFSPLAVNVLFGRLNSEQKELTISLLRLSSVNVFLLSILQTTNGALIGRGRLYLPVISLSVGVAVKIIVSVILLKIESVNIFGGAVAVIACYFSSSLINFIMIIFRRVTDGNKEYKGGRNVCPQ